MSQSAISDYNLMAFNINESATGKRNSQAENIQEKAGAIKKHASDESVNVQGQKKVSTNSGEDSNFF